MSVERINETEARRLAPSLWNSPEKANSPRYRLAPLNEASVDAMWTRFICRFHTTDFTTHENIVLNETLSRYHFNYDHVAYRKGWSSLLTSRGSDNHTFWTSTLLLYCPVPANFQIIVSKESTILSDGTPTLHMDIIPIRTSPRYGSAGAYLTEDMVGPGCQWTLSSRHD